MEAAKTVGGAVQDKFQWGVKMKNYDMEVCLNTDLDQAGVYKLYILVQYHT